MPRLAPQIEDGWPLLHAFLAGLAWDVAAGAALLATGAVAWWILSTLG